MYSDTIPLHKQVSTPAKSASGSRTIITGILLFSFTVLMGLINLYFGTGIHGMPLFLFYFSQSPLVLLNLFPFVLLAFLIWFITNQAWLGFLLSGSLALVQGWAENWKLLYRSEPIYFSDLSLIQEAVQISERYIEFQWTHLFSALFLLAATLLLLLFFRGKLRRVSTRCFLGVSSLILSGILFLNGYANTELYSSFPVWDQLSIFFESNKYISCGTMYPFLRDTYETLSANGNFDSISDTSSSSWEITPQELLASFDGDPIPQDKQVSVVFTMLEAFSDLSLYTDEITGADPYESYHAIVDESYHGNLITNIFGGGTCTTERSVLTGLSELHDFAFPCWSYARYFKQNGYALNGSHPGVADYYDRVNINRNLGFDEYYFRDNYYQTDTPWYAGDEILLPAITELCLADIASGKHTFSFNVTYQNHGPYSTTYQAFEKDYVPKGRFDQDTYMILNNYLWGIEKTSRLMLDMVNDFRELEEPVILVFFGDHKPWLGDQSYIYDLLGIDINSNSPDSFINYYSTEYLIWANTAARQLLGNDFCGVGPDISPCFLMNELFRQCGWEGPAFMKLSNEVETYLPILTTNNRFEEDSQLVTEDALSAEAAAILDCFRKVESYLAEPLTEEQPQ